jgi:hypothetical protein
MRAVRHEFVAFSAAGLLHVAALLVLKAAFGDFVAAPLPHAPLSPELSFEVDVAELAAAEPSLDVAGEASAVAARQAPLAPSHAASGATKGAGTAERATIATDRAVEVEEIVLDEASDERAGETTPSKPIDLGIGADGWQRWASPGNTADGARAERKTPRRNRFEVFRAPPASTTGGLQEGLEESDRALGLGPSGRVLSATHAAAHITAAPYVGVARFDVTVHRTGVVEVSLGSASGQVEQWKRVAARIAEELRAAPPRIAPPRDGVKLVIELVAEETMPNGTKVTELHGPRIEAEPPKLKSTEKTLEQLMEDNPTTTAAEPEKLPPIKLDLPGVYLAERGKVCSYRLGISVMGPVFQGGCDPAHIGAKPQRMVRTRVLEQRLF